MRLTGKVACITGAGAGLGRESALVFAAEGARIAVLDVSPERAAGTVALVREAGGEAEAFTVDVTVEADVARAVEASVARFGGIDIMFANAGVQVPGYPHVAFEDLTEAAFRRVVDVNLLGVFFSIKHAVAPLRARGGGAVVVTSSATALAATRNLAPYAATKGGVNALVRAAAVDLGKYGIRVNAICPMNGMSPNFLLPPDAPVSAASMEEARGTWDPATAHQPLKRDRPPTLRDNAMAALFLASDESGYTTGVCMPVTDGGILAGAYLHL